MTIWQASLCFVDNNNFRKHLGSWVCIIKQQFLIFLKKYVGKMSCENGGNII